MASPSLPLVPLAKAIGITSSMFLAGMTTSYSFIAIPTIIDEPSEARMLAMWRRAYRIGKHTQPPQCIVACLSWTYLALTVPREAVALRVLYGAAAILIPSIVPLTIFGGRSLIGTLSLRADRLCGADGESTSDRLGFNGDSDDKSAAESDEASYATTRRLVQEWSAKNYVRAALVGLGAFCGVWASLNEAFLSGVQVGAETIIGELLKQQALAKVGVPSS